MNTRELFLKHVAQTSLSPLALEIEKADGVYLYDIHGKKYIDMISGISVCNVGHNNHYIIDAITAQLSKYLHVMVYGETVQSPQVKYAQTLAQHLPSHLDCVYFTNSGSEATEGAMKLAKRVTKRSKIIAFNHSYHGSTQGALSVIGDEYWRNAYRPLLPDIYHYDYNNMDMIQYIDSNTACIILESVQSEAGVIVPDIQWLAAINKKCKEVGALIIVDEIQTGFGRTGDLFFTTNSTVVPDILLLGKALGGGMPLGAFISSRDKMQLLTHNPVLGHITTFGGHPVSCAAGLASLQFLLNYNIVSDIKSKESLFISLLQHSAIVKVNHCGLLIAIFFKNEEICHRVIEECLSRGVFTDWFLFAPQAMRIAPPLTITNTEIETACHLILQSIEQVCG